jgi:hypothetical protein
MKRKIVLITIFLQLFLVLKCELPAVISATYETKSLSLLGNTADVAVSSFCFFNHKIHYILKVISVEADQELFLIRSVLCPPYVCTAEEQTNVTESCLCDYTHSASNGCGTPSREDCTCDQADVFCDEQSNSWTDLQDGVSVYFELQEVTHYSNFRFYMNQPCKAVVVCFSFLPSFPEYSHTHILYGI